MKIVKSNIFNAPLLEVTRRALSVPFGNSNWQIDSITSNAKTPERAYRDLLLNFTTRLNDLKTAERKRRKDIIEVKLLQKKIDNEKNNLKKELLNIDIEEIESGYEYTNKLALDCVDELNHMWDYIKEFPEYTRENFEAGEIEHFKQINAPENNADFLFSLKNKQLENNTKRGLNK